MPGHHQRVGRLLQVELDLAQRAPVAVLVLHLERQHRVVLDGVHACRRRRRRAAPRGRVRRSTTDSGRRCGRAWRPAGRCRRRTGPVSGRRWRTSRPPRPSKSSGAVVEGVVELAPNVAVGSEPSAPPPTRSRSTTNVAAGNSADGAGVVVVQVGHHHRPTVPGRVHALAQLGGDRLSRCPSRTSLNSTPPSAQGLLGVDRDRRGGGPCPRVRPALGCSTRKATRGRPRARPEVRARPWPSAAAAVPPRGRRTPAGQTSARRAVGAAAPWPPAPAGKREAGGTGLCRGGCHGRDHRWRGGWARSHKRGRANRARR